MMMKPRASLLVSFVLQFLVVIGNTVVVLAQQAQSADNAIHPAPVSCNAAYSAPCARTNSQYLALHSKQYLYDLPPLFTAAGDDEDINLRVLLDQIQAKQHNMDTGFYPFVFNSRTAICEAHGANPSWAGSSLSDIFDEAGIHFANVNELHERFVDAANRGGDWVQYLWTDITDDNSENDSGINIHSKRAYVTNLTTIGTESYYIGVGYENRQLPIDTPCSASNDAWCSITNVRSLTGKAQFLLETSAVSRQTFEAALYDLSFNTKEYTIQSGFYPFVYHYDGRLVAHSRLHNSFGLTLATIFDQNKLGTTNEGQELHEKFVLAAEAQQQGTGSGWVQYPWRNSLEETPYIKIAYITKIEFEDEPYYLGVGYNFEMEGDVVDDNAVDDDDNNENNDCSAAYNLPCSFKTTLQLSSHALSHAISSSSPVAERFQALTFDDNFRRGDFYVFAYDYNGTCVAHGLVPDYAGLTLTEVFDLNDITLDAAQLHDQFRGAASRGGGWVAYDWLVPNVQNSEFEKISYLFQLSIDGRDYYGGVGFNHEQAPVQVEADYGLRKNGAPISCSRSYGLPCSDTNARSILGQAAADLTLATSPVGGGERTLDRILDSINNRDHTYLVNDFFVSVFSADGKDCDEPDNSGCCIAHGSDVSMVGLTWQQILDEEGITSMRGADLHARLIAQSNTGGSITYPWSGGIGEARTKRSWVARFREEGKDYYVVAEHFTTPQPPTCNACPSDMECTTGDQSYCEDKPPTPLKEEPAFIALIVLVCIGVPTLIACFMVQKKRSKKRSLEKIRAVENKLKDMTVKLEQSMQGMVTVTYDMPIQSPEKYKQKIADNIRAASSRSDSAAVWYWEEDGAHIHLHNSSMVLPSTNFVCYTGEVSRQLEHAYQLFAEGKGFNVFNVDLSDKITKVNNANTGARYDMHFDRMVQKNSNSRYERTIRREEVDMHVDSAVVDALPDLPEDIDFSDEAEDLLPTYSGQVIQVSKVHPSKKWLFGNVLFDPLLNDALKQQSGASSDGLNSMLAHALHDRPTSGWFPKSVTKPADLNVMRKLLDTLGGEGAEALKPPETWEAGQEGRIAVPQGTREYQEVNDFFLAALYSQRDNVTVTGIERIQNMPLWQSYSVKKQTMRSRDKKDPNHRVNNRDLDLVERRWLFHGTKADVIPKIEKQGFNRAFAGRNAVAYGKGCYYARDASYSCHPIYSEPDTRGVQRMFLCRVAVGDWCKGSNGQLAPDPKPHNNLELFDSTVDNEKNPSIFVVYHDAQAYPDYLVAFKRK